jgi:hypothetical protein
VALKQLYLDAIGEPAGSPRRSAVSGLQAAYTLNQGQAGREVQVVLLDERWAVLGKLGLHRCTY